MRMIQNLLPCTGSSRKPALLLLAPFLLLAGCDNQSPQTYTVAKTSTPPPTPAASAQDPHAGMQTGAHGGMPTPKMNWTAPEGWQELGPSEMSPANFAITNDAGQASVSIISLPGKVASELDVINIFRERFNLTPLDQAGLTELAETTQIGKSQGNLYDMFSEADASQPAGRVLVAILDQAAFTYYIRMTGDAPAVESSKPGFRDFLKTLEIEEISNPMMGNLPASHPPIGTPSNNTTPSAPVASGANLPEWQVPAGWTAQTAPRMVLARFSAGSGDQTVDIAISNFPGDVGGAAANVNRWRGQVGLPAVPEAEALQSLETITTADGEAQILDITGNKRMIGAIVPRNGSTWFYKLTGGAEGAEAQKAAFIEFLRSSKHPQK
jgi:hypothetical protein